MAKYCSYEARKVIEAIKEYGLTIPESHYFDVEVAVGKFWNTHIQQIVAQVMKGGDTEKKIAKATEQGWPYFDKPVWSLLMPRTGAHRAEEIIIDPDHEWTRSVYNMLTSGFVVADFNMKELALLAIDIPPMIREPHQLTLAKQACGETRSLYYIHGVIRRDYQTAQGRIRQIQEAQDVADTTGWTPDADFEKMDVVERLQMARDWQDRLNNIKINRALNACTNE